MASLAPAPRRPAGRRSQSSARLAMYSRKSTTKLYMWRSSGQVGCASPPTSRWNRLRATGSPWRQILFTLRGHPTTVRRTQPQEAWEPRDVCATAPRCTRTVVTSCAAAGVTTRTNTPKCGSATVNSNGAASSNATRAARGRRCLPANKAAGNSNY